MSLPTHQVGKFNCRQGAVRAVRFNFDGNYCLTCGSDKSVKLWNPLTYVVLQSYMGHGYEVLDAQGSCDNSQITSGGMDKAVFLYDVTTTQAIRRFRGHAGYVNSVKFNEDSSAILSGSVDGTVHIWDCRSRSREPIQVLRDAKDTVTCVCVSAHEIVTSSLDCCIRRYDLRLGKLFQDDIKSAVTSVCFTKDGGCILASCLDSTIKLIDKETGDILSEYDGHKNDDYRIDSCMNDTDSHVVSGSEDGTVYFWDLVEGKIKEKLQHDGHKVVHSLSFHPKKPLLLTASEGFVYVWQDPAEVDSDDNDD